MKKLAVVFAVLVSAAASAARLDGIAARVDSNVITVGDVMNELRRNPEAGRRMTAANEEEMESLYRAALDSLVERRLVLKAAAVKSVEIPEWVIDNQLREIVHNSFGGDMNRLQEELARSKVPMTEYRNSVKEDILVRGMRQQMIDQFVFASPAAMKKEYESNPQRYRQEGKTSVRVILLKPGSEADGVPSLGTRWAQIGEEMASGVSFSDLAIKYSAESHAKDGGLWKDVNPKDEFRPEVAQAIAKLEIGAVSDMIDIGGWGFVVKKESETREKSLSFSEAYDMVAENVRNAAAKKSYDEWIARLKEDAFVKIYPMPKE